MQIGAGEGTLVCAVPRSISSLVRSLTFCILLAALLFGFFCVAASFVPYATVFKMMEHQYGTVLTARRLPREFYQQKQFVFRVLGFLALVFAGIVSRWRAALDRFLSDALSYLSRGWHRSLNRARYAFRHTERSEILDIAILTAVGLADRAFFLLQPIRFDEAVGYLDYASKPLYLLLSVYTEPENHVFETVLVHFSTGIFGNHLWSLRLPALIAGILMVPLTYLACRQLCGRLPAIVAASLVAASPVLIEYSTDARGYTILICCFLMLILAGALVLRKTDPILLLLAAVAAAIGFYTIPIMLLPAGAVLVWGALSVWRRRPNYLSRFLKLTAASVIVAGFLTLIFYGPILIGSGWRALLANPYVVANNFHSFVTRNEMFLPAAWRLWNLGVPAWASALMLAGFVFSLILPIRNLELPRRLILAICLWCFLVVVALRISPFPRVWLFLLPVYFMAVAAGWVSFSERLIPKWRGWQPVWRVAGFLLLGILSLRSVSPQSVQSVLNEGETGTCRDADKLTDYLVKNNIPLTGVFRSSVCHMPMVYYYLRKTDAKLADIRFLPVWQDQGTQTDNLRAHEQAPPPLWVFVNASQGDSLASVLRRGNLDGIQVLSKAQYEGGYLCEIQIAPAQMVANQSSTISH